MAQLDNAIYQFQREDEETHAKSVANIYKLHYVNLVGYPILPRTLELVTTEEMKRYGVVPFLKVDHRLRLATSDPTPAALEFIQTLANRHHAEIELTLCSDTSLRFVIRLAELEDQKKSVATRIEVTAGSQKSAIDSIDSRELLEDKLRDASATQVLDILFAGATGLGASDLHIEPQEDNVRVRYRLDGVLQEITFLPVEVYRQVLSRVKFLAKMKLDVKQVNQDGRFTITTGNGDLDVRVSTLPSTWGEILDMRLLRAHAEFIKLNELGLTDEGLAAIREAVNLPHGMVLVTGPTGSGKTTTLYAILQELNKPGVKIITLEDPVEYRLPGIDQVAISHEKNGLSFAEGLKGALRQDPDILLVGEIRDRETAEVGLSAAMTGHLFLSTLHTNNAPASMARLLDMGIEPYKIAGAVNLIIAQRLVRKICTTCQGHGCAICYSTGYKGRLPIIEYLKPTHALDEAIMKHSSVSDLYSIATKGGMLTMHDDGMKKVAAGLTTKDEVDRVTAEISTD